MKQAWREAEALYELARNAPAQYRGQFTQALFGERAELGDRCLVEATARRIVHRLLRMPIPKREKRKGRVPEKWMENHYQYASVETDFTKQVVDEKLMEKFLVNGSATLHVAQRGFDPAARREAGLPAANLETFLSGPMRNAIIDYLWKIEGQKADDLLASGNRKYVQPYDDDGELPVAEIDEDDDNTLFADFDLAKITEEFESCLPDEAHCAVFRTYVANGNGLEATALLLGIGVKTCQKHLDTIEKKWASFRMYQEMDID